MTCNGKLTGVVSFGIGCANSSSPAVYTRIQHYAEWIEVQIKSNDECSKAYQNADVNYDRLAMSCGVKTISNALVNDTIR